MIQLFSIFQRFPNSINDAQNFNIFTFIPTVQLTSFSFHPILITNPNQFQQILKNVSSSVFPRNLRSIFEPYQIRLKIELSEFSARFLFTLKSFFSLDRRWFFLCVFWESIGDWLRSVTELRGLRGTVASSEF